MTNDKDQATDFAFWGDYEEDYSADAIAEGFAVIEEITERDEKSVGYTGTGPTSTKVRTAKVRVTKPGFAKPGPSGDTEAAIGCIGYCPAEWVGR